MTERFIKVDSSSSRHMTTGTIEAALAAVREKGDSPEFTVAVAYFNELAAAVGDHGLFVWDLIGTFPFFSAKKPLIGTTSKKHLFSHNHDALLIRNYSRPSSGSNRLPFDDYFDFSLPWFQRLAAVNDRNLVDKLTVPMLKQMARSLGLKEDSDIFKLMYMTVSYRLSHPERLCSVIEPNVTVTAGYIGKATTPSRISDLELQLEIDAPTLAAELTSVTRAASPFHSFMLERNRKVVESLETYVYKGYVPLLRRGFAASRSS